MFCLFIHRFKIMEKARSSSMASPTSSTDEIGSASRSLTESDNRFNVNVKGRSLSVALPLTENKSRQVADTDEFGQRKHIYE